MAKFPPLPKKHPLWPSFLEWIVAGHLHPDIAKSPAVFDRHGRIMWETFLAGARTNGN